MLEAAVLDTSAGLLLRVRDLSDRAAWERLVCLYEPLLHAWVSRFRAADREAEDVVQDVLLVVAREMPDADEPESSNPVLNWVVGKLLRTASKGMPKGGRIARVRLTIAGKPGSQHCTHFIEAADRPSKPIRHPSRNVTSDGMFPPFGGCTHGDKRP